MTNDKYTIPTLIKRFARYWMVIVLVLVGFVTFANSFQNQFVWDDPAFFADNILVKSLNIPKIFTSNTVAGAAIASDYYRPITSLTFGLDYQVWKLNPFGFHLTNTILHILTALLIFSFLKLVGFNKILSLFVSLIFLVHPVQVEAVTYLSSRGDILYSLLFLVSLYLFTLTLYQPNPTFKIYKSPRVKSRGLLLFLAVIFYGASIFAKEVSLAVWPTFILTLFLFKIQKKLKFKELHQQFRGHFMTVLMLFWTSCLYMFLRVYVLNFNNSLNFIGFQDAYTTNIFVRLMTFLKVTWLYIGLIFYPYPLYLERNTTIETNFFSLPVISAFLLILLLFALGIWEYKKTKTLWIFLGLLWIALHITPVSGIVPMTYLYHENWLYMPIVGVTIILFKLFDLFFPKFNYQKFQKYLLFGGALIILVLITLTIRQNTTWKDPITLFEHNLKYNQTARLHLNLGNSYLDKGNLDQAIYHLNEAAKIADIYPQIHFNLGYVYLKQEKKDQARVEFLKTLELDPNYFYAYPMIVNSYIETKEYDKALPYVSRLNQVYPEDLTLTLLYGKLLFVSNSQEKAEAQFVKALKLSNDSEEVKGKISKIKKGEEIF